MTRTASLLGAVLLACLALPATAQLRQGTGATVAERFQQLSRQSRWQQAQVIPLQFDAFHPQGLARVGERWFLSAVEVQDRAASRGIGHLFEVSDAGRRLRSVQLGEGPIYHPGGIDFDGRFLWVPVAEYRPQSTTIVYRVRSRDLRAEEVFRFGDHLGALVRDVDGNRLVGVSWGARRFYAWELKGDLSAPRDPAHPLERPNGNNYIDYQDGISLRGTPFALFGGVAPVEPQAQRPPRMLGGLDLVELRTLRAVHQLPLPLLTEAGQPMTRNPVHVEPGAHGLRFAFAPDDGRGRIYIYEVR